MEIESSSQAYLGLGFLRLKRRLGDYFTCVANVTVIFNFIDTGKSSLQRIVLATWIDVITIATYLAEETDALQLIPPSFVTNNLWR